MHVPSSNWQSGWWAGSELALELDSDGTSYTYLWGPGRIPLSVTAKTAAGVSTTYAYHVDALGSVIAMTDANGTAIATYAYDPWGRVTSTTGTGIAARNPLRYRAYYLDAETGLYYMPARYYDPATYRFLSADPASPSAGDPGSLNAFAYCGDDPIDAIDASGARADWDGDGKVGVEDNKISNEQAKKYKQRQEAAQAKQAQDAAAARSVAMEAYFSGLLAYLNSLNWSMWPTAADDNDVALDEMGTFCEGVEVLGMIVGGVGGITGNEVVCALGGAILKSSEVVETMLDVAGSFKVAIDFAHRNASLGDLVINGIDLCVDVPGVSALRYFVVDGITRSPGYQHP